jgi:hypothetical protein
MSILSGCHKDTIEETEINDFIQQSILNKTPTPENKYAVLMVGLPGSGKTGARERCIPDDADLNNFVVVDVDMIITQFFTNDIKCYKEAYIICEKWISFCTENGYNIILEGTGKDLDKRINNFNSIGYKVILCINLVKVQTAQDRVKKREMVTARHVRPEYIDEVNKILKDKIQQYIKNEQVHDLYILENENQLTRICKGKADCLNNTAKIESYFITGGKSRRRYRKKSKRNSKRKQMYKRYKKTKKQNH